MAITPTQRYLDESKKPGKISNVIIEVFLDSGTQYWGIHSGLLSKIETPASTKTFFSSVRPILGKVSSFQNKLDPSKGVSTRGSATSEILGRENFRELIANEFLKNRDIIIYNGFVAQGFTWADYLPQYVGVFSDWEELGDVVKFTFSDNLLDGRKKIPESNVDDTQIIDLRSTNPVDMMTALMITELGISASKVDTVKFLFEKNIWFPAYVFDRVYTEPEVTNDLLNDLQQSTGSFIFDDGEK